jgi:4-amino-4-deoxy-L-arabinose transferase-like glycosyltransferase
MKTNPSGRYTIAIFALIKFLVPFLFIHSQFELHRDEYLYLADSDHMAWGYIEMPPMLAALGYISKLLGGSIYSVYLWGGLSGALTMILVGMMVLRLKGNVFAVFIACLSFLCAGFLRMHILFQPNFLDVLFWTWSSYLIICWIDSDQKKYLYWLGICFGLGILGKYSMGFYIIAFLLGVLLTEKRKWLLNPHFYFAMLTGVIVCLPNLIWQYNHHFPLMHHMDLLTNQQLKYNSRMEFIVNQLLISLPSVVIWIGGLFYLLRNQQGKKYRMIAIIYIGIIALLLYFNGKGYYAAAIYPTLMVFGAVWFSRVVQKTGYSWLKFAMPAFIFIINLVFLPLLLPVLSPTALANFYKKMGIENSGPLKWEDRKPHALPQDFADMLGWKEMTEKTAKVYNALPDSVKQQTMVYGDNYGEAGALSFYGRKLGLPEIFSDNASYVFWLPDEFTKKYFLFVTDELPEEDDRFFHHWGNMQVMDSVTNVFAREYGTKIILYSNPNDSVRIIAEANILREKKQFGFK